MVKNNEIMIGNTFLVGKGTEYEKNVVVDEVLHSCVGLHGREFHTFLAALEPMPITEELLLKNGFNKELLIEGMENYDDWVSYKKEVNGYFLDIRHCSNSIERDWYVQIDNDAHCSVGSMDIEYVHQLQNTCRLAGFEIELKV